MNFLQRAFSKMVQSAMYNPIMAAYTAQYGANQPQHMSANYPTFAKEGYRGNDTVYKCISYLSRNASAVDWGLYTDRFKRDEIEQHPILDLWWNPNPDQYLAEFVEDWSGTLLLGGNGFIKSEYLSQNFNFNTPPDGLYVLRPDWVDVIPDASGIIGYQFGEYAYDKKPIPPFQVGHTKYWHPDDVLRGLSPIEVAAIFVDMQTSGNKWNLALMQNSARPPGAWVTDQMLTKTALDTLKGDLQKEWGGIRNAGKAPVLYGGLKWQSMSITPAELDWLNSRMRNAADIANIYNLSPQLIGDTSASTYNNMESAKLASYFEAVFPMVLNKLQAVANRWLVPKFGDPSLYLAYKPESVPAIQQVIQQQLSAKSDRATKIYMSGGINLDEYRAECGWEELPEGTGQVRRVGGILVPDESILEFAQQSLKAPAGPNPLVPENLLNAPPAGAGAGGNNADTSPADDTSDADANPADSDSGNTGKSRGIHPSRYRTWTKALDLATSEQKDAYLAHVEEGRKKWETEVVKRLQDYFEREQQLVHHAIDQAAIPSSAADRVELALKQLEPHLKDIISGIWQDVAGDFAKTVGKQLKLSQRPYNRKSLPDIFTQQTLTYLLTLAGQKVVGINATTLAMLQNILAIGVANGDSILQLAKSIDTLYLNNIIPNRSQVIASTEVCGASNYGSLQAAQSSGLTLNKVWLATADAHTRETHAAADGQEVPINEPFEVGGEQLDYPGAPGGSAAETINCRCSQFFRRVQSAAPNDTGNDIEQASRVPQFARKTRIPDYSQYRKALRKQVSS